jgi:hypothetical protein
MKLDKKSKTQTQTFLEIPINDSQCFIWSYDTYKLLNCIARAIFLHVLATFVCLTTLLHVCMTNLHLLATFVCLTTLLYVLTTFKH